MRNVTKIYACEECDKKIYMRKVMPRARNELSVLCKGRIIKHEKENSLGARGPKAALSGG